MDGLYFHACAKISPDSTEREIIYDSDDSVAPVERAFCIILNDLFSRSYPDWLSNAKI